MSTATGAACDGYGASATYEEIIDSSGDFSKRTITASGCPNHYSLCTGKSGTSGCGGVGERGTATEAAEQSHALEVPSSPVLRGSWGVDDEASTVQCSTDAIGIALNGVTIFTAAVGGDDCTTFVDVDDISSEWNSFDCCSGHTRSFMGATYHYHFPPSCLLAQIGDLVDGHSPQIGWALDGFPIYGPKGPNGVDMKYGGSLGPCTGDYCLDQCGGVEAELPEVDAFSYRYYVVGATSDLSTIPNDPKPSTASAAVFSNGRVSFSLNCYRGYLYSELTAGSTGSSGVTGSYTATALAGFATKYEPDGLCETGSVTTLEQCTNGWCSSSTSSSCNSAYLGVGSTSEEDSSTPSPTTPSPSTPSPPTPTPTPLESGTASASTPCAQASFTVCTGLCAVLLALLL